MSLQYANWEPPTPPVARKWLNEAASLPANPSDTIQVDAGNLIKPKNAVQDQH
jgi:hypothetical protein